MSSSLLNIGTQALRANSAALSYTGQNISNVNTEGYSRQRVNLVTQEPPILGVAIQDVQRITDEFLVEQVWRDQAAFSSTEQQAKKIELLDKLMVSDATSLSSAMDDYFSALQRAVDDPLFIANRQLFLAEAESLVSTFQDFDQRLLDQQRALTTEASSMVSTINTLTGNIAALNVKIASVASGGQNYNALIDERDKITKELSKYVSVDVVSSDGGITNNILLANGEPLVTSGRAVSLAVRDGSPDPAQIRVVLTRGDIESDITSLLGEGSLGGLFSYRDDILQPARSEVGRLALLFSTTMNEQHRKGLNLNGEMGGDLFTPILTAQSFGNQYNQTQGVSTSLTFSDVTKLTGSDYSVEITGLDSFRIRRLSDGVFFDSNRMEELSTVSEVGAEGAFSREVDGLNNTLTIQLDGFTFRLKSSELPKRGDMFLLQPTKTGARDIGLAISNPKSLALASPLRVTPGQSNAGNAGVTGVEVLDGSVTSPLRSGGLNPPIEIVFNALNEAGEQTYNIYDISDATNPVLMEGMENLFYEPGVPIVMQSNGLDVYQITISNQPKAGDRFAVEFNTDGYSDNTNALAMADLQRAEIAFGSSYQDIYGQLVAKVGTQANTIQASYFANQAILSASENALESVRGVNLDEEATKLIQFQQAYTASTRLITAYQDMFDSLIAAVR